MNIRRALPADGPKAAVLIYDAIHDIAHALTGETIRDRVLEQLEKYFVQEINRLSYRNCWVKLANGAPVGIVLAYHGKDAAMLDEPLSACLREKRQVPSIDREADDSDFYIDTLSVDPLYRGRGFGTELLDTAISHAKQMEYPSVSLNVEENNIKAKKLYERLGFQAKKQIPINGHLYTYMIKTV